MTNLVVYNGITAGNDITYSDWFTSASFFYFEVFGTGGGELELDCFLNIVVEEGVTKVISILDGTDLNFVDTERVFRIPVEFSSPDLQKRLILIPNAEFNIKVTVVDGFSCNADNGGALTSLIASLLNLLSLFLPEFRVLLQAIKELVIILRNLLPGGFPTPVPINPPAVPITPGIPVGILPGLPVL